MKKKRKSVWITKKGWADVDSDGTFEANSLGGNVRRYPCEIRIKRKYLEEKK